jgi:hypothetical protein
MLPALLLVLATLVPTIDMQRSCIGVGKQLPTAKERKCAELSCMDAERCALKELKELWSTYPAAARQPCAALAQVFDDYVELKVCIQIRCVGGCKWEHKCDNPKDDKAHEECQR